MDTKRRIVCFLLMLAMAAGMVPSAAFAVETGEGPAIAAGTNNASPAECLCNAPCTPEAVNQACPVCGAEGADLADCAGKAPAAPSGGEEGNTPPPAGSACTCTEQCAEENRNDDCPVCGAEGADLADCAGKAPATPSGGEEGNTPPPAGSACTCTEQCGEENRNDDCPVCGAEGADLASCAAAPQGDQVPPATCTCTQPCAPDSVNADCPVCGADGADLAHCAAALLGMNGAISTMSVTGSGTADDPYRIYTQEDLEGIGNDSTGKYYKLENDIALTSDWWPIVSFYGTLDGGDYTIRGLNVTWGNTQNLGGIVYTLQEGATIKNLNVIGSVTSYCVNNARVGGIVGYNYGTVENCTFSGSVTGGEIRNSNNGAIGGIAGRSDGTITGCINNANVSGQGTNELYVGGITGSNHGTLANCTNTGAISGKVTYGSTNYGPIWGSETWKTSGGYVGGIAGDTTANAANTGNTNAGEVIYNDQTVVEAHKHDDVHFTQVLNSNTLTGGDLAPGNYYLTGDIDLSADGKNAVSIQITGTVNLCLNGHSIRSNASAGIFRIGAGGELNVYDCNGSEVGNGMITETGNLDHNPIFLHSGGTLRLYGGKIEAYRTAIVIDEDPATGGTDMTGGTVYIHGGTVSSTGTGYQAIKVNAEMTNSAVYIQGGTVTSANRGISAESGEIHISGGTVSGSNYALEASSRSTSTVYLSNSPDLSGAVKISPASAADKAVLVLKDADTAYMGAGLSIYSNDETNCENKYVARGVESADMAKGFSLVSPTGYSLEYDADNKAIQIIKRNFYTVTLPTDSGYTIIEEGSTSPVAEGGSYSFTLEITEGYYKTNAFAVKANGTELKETGGVYTISDIRANQTVTVQGVARDNTAPTVTIHLEENKWSAFPSSHAFSLFFKNAQTVEITATDDAGSGVAGTEYFVSDVSYASPEALEAAAKKQWKTYSNSFTIAPNSKNVIYAKATDKMGNVGYASSAGIVLYTDSQQDTQSISFTKTGTDAVTADVTLNGNTVDEIYCGSDMLTAGTDYMVSGGTITFKASWLNTLSAGDHTLTVHYNPLGVPYEKADGNDAPNTTSIALSVSKATGSVTINDISKVYDGEPVTVTYQTLSTGKVTVEYKAKTADDSAYTANTPSAVGDYTVWVTVAADGNYTEASATKDFTIRYLEAPENPYTLSGEIGDNGWYTSDVTITPPEGYTVSSTLPGEYAEKLTIDESADGVTIYLKNQQGQMTDAITVSEEIKIDQDDPEITATGDTANYLQKDRVAITASDVTSGVAKVEVRKDSGEAVDITDSYTNGYFVTENGTYTFRVTDHAGRTKETTLVYDNLDAKTPVVTIIATTDDDEAYTSDTWTNKTITLTPENNTVNLGETTYQYRVGSGEWQRYTGPVVVDADTAAEGAVYAFKATSASGVESSEVSITVKRDAEAPSGDIAIEKVSIHQSLGNGIAFDLFYNKDVEITIRGEDTLSGVNSIQYYRSAEILTEDALAAVTGWENYHDQPIQETAKDAVKFVYYVKVTDNAGNVTRFGSKGVTFDLTPPQISGVDDDSTYYTTQKVEVTDANLQSVTLNDAPDTFENNQLTLTGNMEAAYTIKIKAVDKAGNEREITVFMKPIQSLAEDIAGLTKENVTADDRDAIVAVQTAVNKVDTEHATDATVAEKNALQDILDRCEELLKKLDEVKREIADVTGAVASYKEDTVKSSDEDNIESLIQHIDSLLDGENLTDSEREALDQARESAEGLLEQITATANEIAAVTDAVDSYEKDTVKSSDKDDIESLIQRIDSLLAGENLTDSEREELKQARESAEGLLEQITATANEIAAVTDAVDSYEKDTVKSSDEGDIESLIQRIDSLLDGENLTDSEQEALEQARESAKGLLEQIHEATQASNTEHIQSAQEIEPNQAAPKDKANLEAAKGDIEKALNDYAGNYTEAEKERLQEILQQIEEALKVIQRIEDMAGSVVLLPEIVIVDDIQGERRSYADREQHTQEDALQAQEGLVAQRMGYHIIEGNGSSWTKGSAQGATFIADGPYSKFTGIAIDGIAISGENYTAESGSTVITLSPDYLNTLSEADHAIAVLYTDGEALGTFTIAGGAAETSASGQADSARPAAGTAAQVIPWIILLVILILVGIMLALRASRKKKMPE